VVRVCSSRRHNKSQRSAIRVESREPAIDVYNTTGDCFISLRAVVRDKAEVVRAHRFPMHTRPFCFNRAGAGGQGAEGRQPPPPPATSLPYPPPRNRSPTQAFTLLSRRALFPQIHTHIYIYIHTHTHTHTSSHKLQPFAFLPILLPAERSGHSPSNPSSLLLRIFSHAVLRIISGACN
jgi:hypothetical protein